MRGLRTGPSHNQNLFLLLQKPLLLSSHLARKTLQPAVNGSKMLARTSVQDTRTWYSPRTDLSCLWRGAHLVVSSRTDWHRTSGAPVVGMFPHPPRVTCAADVTGSVKATGAGGGRVEGVWELMASSRDPDLNTNEV